MFVTSFLESGFLVPGDFPGPEMTTNGRHRLRRVAGVEQHFLYRRMKVTVLESDRAASASDELLIVYVHHPRLSDEALVALAGLLPASGCVFVRSVHRERAEATSLGRVPELFAAAAVGADLVASTLDDLEQFMVEIDGHRLDVVMHRRDGRWSADAAPRPLHETLIGAVVDWPRQKTDFDADGSLRDIYIENATIEDWKIVVARILHGNGSARVVCGGAEASMPADLERVFGGNVGMTFGMTFSVGDVALECHFFSPTEIEFSFEPNEVTESSLRDLLAFMIDIGERTTRSVIMTLENCAVAPIFRYDARRHELRWIAALDAAR